MESTQGSSISQRSEKSAKYNLILLLDDNSLDNVVNQKMIENNNVATHVIAHQSAKATIEYLNTAPDENIPDVIFLDIIMPDVDGFQFLEEFRKMPAKIHDKCKIIMLSTSDSFKDLNRANQSPHVHKFLNKPLTDEVLLAINI